MKMRYVFLLMTVVLCFNLSVFASENTIENQLRAADLLFEKGGHTYDLEQLEQARAIYLKVYKSGQHDYLTAYKIAHTDSRLVDYYNNKSDKKQTAVYIKEAIKYLEKSISMNDNYGDAYCLLAAMIGRKIGIEGIASGIFNRKKSAAALKKAMELDPNNPDVYVGQGITLIATPSFLGGDLDKGIEHLNKALSLDSSKYRAYVWLSKAYRRKGDLSKATEMILKALRHNPNDVGAKQELARLPNLRTDISVR